MRVLGIRHASLLLAVLPFAPFSIHAQDATPSKYPLRIHVLAVDSTFPTPRMQPNWCSGSIPALGGDPGGSSDQGGGPCGGGSSSYFGGSDDFAGSGRGDLVTPPSGTQALSFTYEGCPRVRVPLGFQGLQARWKKPGKLEVLIPSDAIVKGNVSPSQRCTFTVTTYEYVFLRLRDGTILKVSQESYLRKPALRVFLSGGTDSLQSRTTAQTTSVKQLMQSPQ